MAKLSDKVRHVLNEARIGVLGAQVLLAFQFRVGMEPGLLQLPPSFQALYLAMMVTMMGALVLLFLPVAYHRIVEQGHDTDEFHDVASHAITWALVPVALALGMMAAVASRRVLGDGGAAALGLVLAVAAALSWFGGPLWAHRQEEEEDEDVQSDGHEDASLAQRIEHLLTECRMILPGAQTLLGFGFAAMLSADFELMDGLYQQAHLASLMVLCLATILLLTPSAYHRIVEKGHDDEEFHTFGSRLLLAALAVLAVGICGELFVAFGHVSGNVHLAGAVAGATLVVCLGAWFGYTSEVRSRHHSVPQGSRAPG